MSDLKHKVGDRFKKNEKGYFVDILEIQGGVNPYVLTGGYITNDDNLDAFYTKIEPSKLVEHVWENHPSIDKPKTKYSIGDSFSDDENVIVEIVDIKQGKQLFYMLNDGFHCDDEYCDAMKLITKEPSKLIETEYDGFKEMTESFGKMLNEKNKRYGNAALDPLVIVGKHHRLGAKIDEKLSRIMNADELKKNDLADVIGYCFLICKDKGWTNFDDQLD